MALNQAHIGVLDFIILHFSVQDEDVVVYSEHINTKCHMSTLMINLLMSMRPTQRSHTLLSMLMPTYY